MGIASAAAEVAGTVRLRAVQLWNRIGCAGSEQVAQWSGRAAGWADQGGEAIAALIERAAGRAGGMSHVAAEAAGWRAERLGEHLAKTVRSWAGELGDGVVHLGESAIGPLGVEQPGPDVSSLPSADEKGAPQEQGASPAKVPERR